MTRADGTIPDAPWIGTGPDEDEEPVCDECGGVKRCECNDEPNPEPEYEGSYETD